MPISTLLNFKTLEVGSKRNEGGAGGCGATYDDVERFIRASKPEAYRELLRNYSSASLPLFGNEEDATPGAWLRGAPEWPHDPTTAEDCKNMATLLEKGLHLCRLADDAEADYDELEGAGLFLHEERGGDDQVSLTIELEPTLETERFLASGLKASQPGLEQVCIRSDSDSLRLEIVGDCLGLCENEVSLMCNAVLDRLTDIMTHDLTVRIRRRDPVATAHSMASSLWLAMIAGSLKGRVGKCFVCGKPYVARKERGHIRKTCGDACRKRLSRQNAELNASRV